MKIDIYSAITIVGLIYLSGIAIGFNVGTHITKFNIAQQCALENTFTEHGNEFYCQDINDYHAE